MITSFNLNHFLLLFKTYNLYDFYTNLINYIINRNHITNDDYS